MEETGYLMLSSMTFIGSIVLAVLGFLLGRFYSESEVILSEKRSHYVKFLSALPPLQDTYKDAPDEEVLASLRPAIELIPSLLFYADTSVLIAWRAFHQRYVEAHEQLTPQSPALAPAYKALSDAQNDLILEMRRDAFRWSIFNYRGKSRTPTTSGM
ncbi:MAG: hypothetical protein ACKVLA_15250 [Rhodobacterales bacterium]